MRSITFNEFLTIIEPYRVRVFSNLQHGLAPIMHLYRDSSVNTSGEHTDTIALHTYHLVVTVDGQYPMSAVLKYGAFNNNIVARASTCRIEVPVLEALKCIYYEDNFDISPPEAAEGAVVISRPNAKYNF